MSTVDRFVRACVGRKRLVEGVCSLAWTVDFLLSWLWLERLYPMMAIVFGALPAACSCGLAVFFLFHKISDVSAAIRIESRVPAFDQRLITAVSITDISPLSERLLEETEAVIRQSKNITLVSFWHWLPPAIVGFGLILAHHIFG